jgi:hypothetical protein
VVQRAVDPQVLGEQTGGEPLAQQPDQHSVLATHVHHHCWSLVAPVLMQRPLAQRSPQAPQLFGVLSIVGAPPQQRAR